MPNWKKILFWLAIGTLLTPFVFDRGSYFPFIIGKATAFRILVEIMAVIWVVMVLEEKKKIKLTILQQLVCLYLIVLILSSLWGINPLFSIFSGNERFEGVWGIAHFVLYFLILSTTFSGKEWEKIIKAEVVISTLYSIFAFVGFPYLGNITAYTSGRLAGLTGNPSYFATYLIFNSLLALWLYFRQWQEDKKLFNWWLIPFVFQGIGVFITGTRGGMIGYVAGLGFLLLWLVSQRINKDLAIFQKVSLIILIIISVSLGSLFAFRNSDLVQKNFALERLTSISLKDPTAVSRLLSAQSAGKAFLERPLLGWGPENYQAPYLKYLNPEVLHYLPSDFLFDRAHNKPMEVLATTGILGLLSYLSIFLFAGWFLWRLRKNKSLSLTAILLLAVLGAYFVQNIFLFDFHESYLMFFLVLAFVSFWEREQSQQGKEIEKSSSSQPSSDYSSSLWKILLEIGVVCLVISSLVFGVIKPYLVSRGIISIGKYLAAHQPEKAQRELKILLRNPSFLKEDVIVGAKKILIDQGISAPEKQQQEMIDLLIKEGKQLYFLHPERFLLETTIAQLETFALQWKNSYKAEADTFLADLTKKYPNFPLLYVYYARFYLVTGKADLAYPKLLQAVQLDPSNGPANYFLFLIEWNKGEKEKAQQHLITAVQSGITFQSKNAVLKAAAALVPSHRYDLILKVYQQGLKLAPRDADIYTHIAATYAKLHNKEKAIEFARKAVEIDSNYKEAAEKFIEIIQKEQWDKIPD